MTLSISVSCLVGAVYRASCHRLGPLGAGAKAEFEVKDVCEGSQPVKGTGECLDKREAEQSSAGLLAGPQGETYPAANPRWASLSSLVPR